MYIYLQPKQSLQLFYFVCLYLWCQCANELFNFNSTFWVLFVFSNATGWMLGFVHSTFFIFHEVFFFNFFCESAQMPDLHSSHLIDAKSCETLIVVIFWMELIFLCGNSCWLHSHQINWTNEIRNDSIQWGTLMIFWYRYQLNRRWRKIHVHFLLATGCSLEWGTGSSHFEIRSMRTIFLPTDNKQDERVWYSPIDLAFASDMNLMRSYTCWPLNGRKCQYCFEMHIGIYLYVISNRLHKKKKPKKQQH